MGEQMPEVRDPSATSLDPILPVDAEDHFAEQVWTRLGQTLGHQKTVEEVRRERHTLQAYIDLLLAANDYASPPTKSAALAHNDATQLIRNLSQKSQRNKELRCPADDRIETFLQATLGDVAPEEDLRLPHRTLILDRPGVARELSLPWDRDDYRNSFVESYRVLNGVLHNPKHDRRTTVGTFHIVEGSIPVPGDKREVPRQAFARLFALSLKPEKQISQIPYTSTLPEPAHGLVSLLIRPTLCPAVPGVNPEQKIEVRFFVPGSFVSNLDFVESIFGNGGNPFDPANDSGLDVEHWSGHTGCVILAPQMLKARKKDLGLPHYDEATERQRQDGMCWKNEEDLYNDGQPFKLTCRTDAGVVVTLIADNYFGYCKKEVKTQLSYAANLYGNTEEEHAGGAIAFQSYSLGNEFAFNSRKYNDRTWQDLVNEYPDFLEVDHEQGIATDKRYPQLKYVNENAFVSIEDQTVTWTYNGQAREIPLLPDEVYMGPSGYRVRMERHPAAPTWRLIGTIGEGTFCHKPCTVSGGGKSEISKSLKDFMLYGPIFVADAESDMQRLDEVFTRDYSTRWHENMEDKPSYEDGPSRKLLDPNRSLGSVIKLLTPSDIYNAEYNAWLESIPNYLYALVFIIKRFERPGWETNWRDFFSVDVVNGHPGHELKYEGRTLVGQYLRVGLLRNHSWRTFKLRQDFYPAEKLQTEDDISVSTVVPGSEIDGSQFTDDRSYKYVTNCEYRLFQRPDEAINRGMDKQAEADLSQPENFLSNFQPLNRDQIDHMVKFAVDLDEFTPPMKSLLIGMSESDANYVVCSSNPRLLGKSVSKNPRYLQKRPDLAQPAKYHIGKMGMRLFHSIPADQPVMKTVDAVLFGRRNNPPDKTTGIKGLCVYSPLHFQPLPELFMDFICSMTGKSPSTTGFGSEGALTKGPFNMLPPAIDLNDALVSYILTGLQGFSTPAGFIGPEFQVDHDISLLIPEIWCRLRGQERDPAYLIREGLLERLTDYEYDGQPVLASRLGYRITSEFVRRFMGRVFDNPGKVFDQPWLRPETQDQDSFSEGIQYITAAQKQVAQRYFDDGTISLACPPIQKLLEVMVNGQGADALDCPDLRHMFTRDYLLASDWYQERLEQKVRINQRLSSRKAEYLTAYLDQHVDDRVTEQLRLKERLAWIQDEHSRWQAPDAAQQLVGSLGAQPLPSSLNIN